LHSADHNASVLLVSNQFKQKYKQVNFPFIAVSIAATLARMSDVTILLDAAAAGDRKAAADLLPLVYDE
jgi:hypothetical protein